MTDRSGARVRRKSRKRLTATAAAPSLRAAITLSIAVGIAVSTAVSIAVAGAAPAFADEPDASGGNPGPVLSQSLSLLAAEASGVTAAEGGAIDPSLGLKVDDAGRPVVNIVFTGADALAAAQPTIAGLGDIIAVTTSQSTIVAGISADRLAAVAALDGVSSVSPVVGGRVAGAGIGARSALPTVAADASCNPLDVEADAPEALDTAAARAAFGVDGSGVTVGIISDSYNVATDPLTTAEQDVAAGALPGSTNPCGFTTDVLVLSEGSSSTVGTTDEGRAMAQLVHGVAPGAKLIFSSYAGTQPSYADSIRALQDHGADIIVDDIINFDEPVYQEGIIGGAIREVEAEGVLYLAAAQNQTSFGAASTPEHPRFNEGENISSWATSAYTPIACPPQVVAVAREAQASPTLEVDCQDFGATSAASVSPAFLQAELGVAPVDPVADTTGIVTMQWGQGGWDVSTAFLLLAFDSEGVALTQRVDEEAQGNLPFAINKFAPTTVAPSTSSYNFAVVRLLDSPSLATPPLKIQFELDDPGVLSLGDGTPWGPAITIGPSIQGHPADSTVLTLGASSVQSPSVIETYSGVGPVRYIFEPMTPTPSPPVPIASPETRGKPDVVSVDKSVTTFFPDGAAGDFRFAGTSAATPNAGAVAALAREFAPGATPAEVRAALVSTATPMPVQAGDYGVSAPYVTGAGRIDAVAALSALAAVVPTPGPSPVPAPGADGNRLADTGADAAGLGGVAGMAVLVALAGAVLVGVRVTSRRLRHRA
jgi:hypothetical protein